MDNAMKAILDAAREYGFFVDRGDPINPDFGVGNFTIDGAFHEIDLSSLVPANAHGVLFTVVAQANLASKVCTFRRAGNINLRNTSTLRTQIADMRLHADLSCPISTDRKIEYNIDVAVWAILNFTVKGWWY